MDELPVTVFGSAIFDFLGDFRTLACFSWDDVSTSDLLRGPAMCTMN